jgi:hypothetical protein
MFALRFSNSSTLKKMRFFLLTALCAALTTATILAQVENGIVTGLVKDSTGAAINKAQVTLRDTTTGLTTVTSTNGEGLYVSPPLTPGTYDVKVEAPGFKVAVEHVSLEVAQRITADAVLAVGATSETVEVKATGALQLDTDTSTISDVRSEQAVHDLPLNGRNFAELLGLSAGVIPSNPQATTVTISESRQQADFSTNGLGSTDNRFLFDGIADNQNHSGNGAIIFPPVDALEEFREETVDADARYGRTDSGTVNVIFKSGTNHYHGEVFDFLRNSVLDAKNYFDTGAKPGFRLNAFGATFGGPLFHKANPKTFFFADYAGQRESQGLTNVDTVPLWGPQGVGDFSLYSTKVVNPQTGIQFPGNYIPPSYLASLQTQYAGQGYNAQVAQNVLTLYSQYGVTPNLPGTANGTVNNFYYAPQRIDNSNAFDVKVNRQFSEADSGFVRFSYELDNIIQPGTLPNPLEGGSTFGFEHEPAYQTVLSETHIFSPSLINTFHFGWSRLFITTKNFDAPLNLPTVLGIPGVIVGNDLLHTDGLPIFSFTGGNSTIGDPGNVPDQLGTNNYEETDDVNLIRGKHSLEFGADVYRMQYDVYMDNDEHGLYSFSGTYTAATVNGSKVAGLGLADLLIGAPATGTYSHEVGTRGARQLGLGFYAQDNYKASSRLTFNLGLRYDNFLGWPWTEVENRMYQFEPALSTTQVFQVGTNGIPRSGAKGNNTNFQPRVGFAYSLTPKTVVHAGFGFYFGAPSVIDTSTLLQNAPAIDYYSFTNPGFGAAATSTNPGFIWLSNGFVHATSTTNAPQLSPLNALDPNSTNPYTEQYHASVEQEIGSASRVTVSYVGNVARHELGTYSINQPTPGTSPTTLQARRPYTYFGSISQQRSSQSSNYNSLQVTAERRTKSLNFQFSYTYSHALSSGVNQNYYNPQADYGNSSFDIPNRFVGSVTYALPFQASGWYRPAVQGWQLNAILNYSDGTPFSVSAGSNTLYNGATSRANLLPGFGNGSLPSNKRSVNEWFNTAAFANPGAQQWGNSGPNILQGPGTKDVDFSVFRDINLTESKGVLQLRGEFFNLFNTPQFNNPNATVGGGFGTITSAGSPVTLQRISREIQLAAKITF